MNDSKTKTEMVKEYLKSNPNAKPPEVVQYFKDKSISISASYVRSVKSKSAKKKPRSKSKNAVRNVVPFPRCQFEEVYHFAKSLYDCGSGHPVRRVSFFDHIGKSPSSSTSRTLVTNSNKYGLIKGSYNAEYLELTEVGLSIFDEKYSEFDQANAKIQAAILNIEPFKFLFDKFKGNKLPNKTLLIDALKSEKTNPSVINLLVDNFIVNAEHVGLLKTLAGAERLVSIDHALESFTNNRRMTTVSKNDNYTAQNDISGVIASGNSNFDTTCFYITPIGEEDSEQRKHADLFLGSIVEPAIEQLNLTVVRADAIDQPGLITNQIIEYILRSKLVIADLSFHNPNVFYELALRHVSKLPTVQIARKGDKLPFDIGNFRTIILDCTDIYTLIPKLETYRSEITAQARRALEDSESTENPVTAVYPNLNLTF